MFQGAYTCDLLRQNDRIESPHNEHYLVCQVNIYFTQAKPPQPSHCGGLFMYWSAGGRPADDFYFGGVN
ncbi:hypothetical protein EFO83_09150 [Lacticaseibacillus rhamnosus]|nr:hypothetical protein [Lacticaseibacillus rhamnosus]MCT3371271.1 hypothetical protein [Lacticaseibacillus rhamnosus]